jgi:hypothetical protein
MASQLNLLRNSRVFFTTNLDASNNVANGTTAIAANTQELTILDNFSFSQGNNADAVTVTEAGNSPIRGQRSFNTSLNPVEFSFSTYIRPNLSTTVKADESHLWNALFGTQAITTAQTTGTTLGSVPTTASCTTAGVLTLIGTAFPIATVGAIYTIRGIGSGFANQFNTPVRIISSTATTLSAQYLTAPANPAALTTTVVSATTAFTQLAWNENVAVVADTLYGNTPYSEVNSARSNVNQLLPFGMIIVLDNVTYAIDNAALDQASIDFGLDGIATVAWTGKGTALRALAQTTITGAVFSGSLSGTFNPKSSVATTRYITNKLSTVILSANIGGGGTNYNIPLTGGSIQIANNINYVTPANLGVVNTPIGYYTGTRAITGSLTAYLRTGTSTTGASNAATLLSDMLANAATVIEPEYALGIQIGGASNPVRVEVQANGANLQIPTINAQPVIAATINFTVQGADAVQGAASSNFDLEASNDLRIRYFTN